MLRKKQRAVVWVVPCSGVRRVFLFLPFFFFLLFSICSVCAGQGEVRAHFSLADAYAVEGRLAEVSAVYNFIDSGNFSQSNFSYA